MHQLRSWLEHKRGFLQNLEDSHQIILKELLAYLKAQQDLLKHYNASPKQNQNKETQSTCCVAQQVSQQIQFLSEREVQQSQYILILIKLLHQSQLISNIENKLPENIQRTQQAQFLQDIVSSIYYRFQLLNSYSNTYLECGEIFTAPNHIGVDEQLLNAQNKDDGFISGVLQSHLSTTQNLTNSNNLVRPQALSSKQQVSQQNKTQTQNTTLQLSMLQVIVGSSESQYARLEDQRHFNGNILSFLQELFLSQQQDSSQDVIEIDESSERSQQIRISSDNNVEDLISTLVLQPGLKLYRLKDQGSILQIYEHLSGQFPGCSSLFFMKGLFVLRQSQMLKQHLSRSENIQSPALHHEASHIQANLEYNKKVERSIKYFEQALQELLKDPGHTLWTVVYQMHSSQSSFPSALASVQDLLGLDDIEKHRLVFYQLMIMIFEKSECLQGCLVFVQLAIAEVNSKSYQYLAITNDEDIKLMDGLNHELDKLWAKKFTLALGLEDYDQAMQSIVCYPNNESSLQSLRRLVLHLYDHRKLLILCDLTLSHQRSIKVNDKIIKRSFFNEAVMVLSKRAKYTEVLQAQSIYFFLYNFLINMNSFQTAAQSIFVCIRRLQDELPQLCTQQDNRTLEMVELIRDLYTKVLSALQGADPEYQWVLKYMDTISNNNKSQSYNMGTVQNENIYNDNNSNNGSSYHDDNITQNAEENNGKKNQDQFFKDALQYNCFLGTSTGLDKQSQLLCLVLNGVNQKGESQQQAKNHSRQVWSSSNNSTKQARSHFKHSQNAYDSTQPNFLQVVSLQDIICEHNQYACFEDLLRYSLSSPNIHTQRIGKSMAQNNCKNLVGSQAMQQVTQKMSQSIGSYNILYIDQDNVIDALLDHNLVQVAFNFVEALSYYNHTSSSCRMGKKEGSCDIVKGFERIIYSLAQTCGYVQSGVYQISQLQNVFYKGEASYICNKLSDSQQFEYTYKKSLHASTSLHDDFLEAGWNLLRQQIQLLEGDRFWRESGYNYPPHNNNFSLAASKSLVISCPQLTLPLWLTQMLVQKHANMPLNFEDLLIKHSLPNGKKYSQDLSIPSENATLNSKDTLFKSDKLFQRGDINFNGIKNYRTSGFSDGGPQFDSLGRSQEIYMDTYSGKGPINNTDNDPDIED